MDIMSPRCKPVKAISGILLVLLASSQALSPFSPRPAAPKTTTDTINVAKKMLELSETKNDLESANALLKKKLESANVKAAEANDKVAEANDKVAQANVKVAEANAKVTEANAKVTEAQRIADLNGQKAARVAKVNGDLLTEIALLNSRVIRLEGVSASLGNVVRKRDKDITVLRQTNGVLEAERRSMKGLAKNIWKVVKGGVSKRATGIKRRLFPGGQAAD